MICLSISNHSEVVASKVGKLLESLTPGSIDQTIVESKVLGKIIENLSIEGIEGNISLVSGIEIKEGNLIMNNSLNVIEQKHF